MESRGTVVADVAGVGMGFGRKFSGWAEDEGNCGQGEASNHS